MIKNARNINYFLSTKEENTQIIYSQSFQPTRDRMWFPVIDIKKLIMFKHVIVIVAVP